MVGLAIPFAAVTVGFGFWLVVAVETGFRADEVEEEGLLIVVVPPVPVLEAMVVEVPLAEAVVAERGLADAEVAVTFEPSDVVGSADGPGGCIPDEGFRAVEDAVFGTVEDGIRLVDAEELGPFEEGLDTDTVLAGF